MEKMGDYYQSNFPRPNPLFLNPAPKSSCGAHAHVRACCRSALARSLADAVFKKIENSDTRKNKDGDKSRPCCCCSTPPSDPEADAGDLGKRTINDRELAYVMRSMDIKKKPKM